VLKVGFLKPIYRRKNPVRTGFDKEESHVLQTLRRRLQGEREGGFTLIELMVVVLIIAILIAIAIPTFLGARTRAQNRAAQASLRNALVAAKSVYTDTQSYATAEGAGLTAVEPALTYKAKGTASTGQNDVSADGTTNAGQWAGAALSASGTCFWIKDNVSTGTTYGSGATCTGTAALGAAGTSW
jgi:type IV pilus assembly protein PilA